MNSSGWLSELFEDSHAYATGSKLIHGILSPYSNLGSSYMILGQYEKAATETREALRLEPIVAAYANLGEIYLALNRFNEARTITDEALRARTRLIRIDSQASFVPAGR